MRESTPSTLDLREKEAATGAQTERRGGEVAGEGLACRLDPHRLLSFLFLAYSTWNVLASGSPKAP
jgi:hypothetical protein